MTPSLLPRHRIAHWLRKTARSMHWCILKAYARDMRPNRLTALVLRYDQLKVRAQALGVWESYYKTRKFAPAHCGEDIVNCLECLRS